MRHNLIQARLDRAQMEAEGAPKWALDAADEAIRCVEAGLVPPAHIQAQLLRYASQRQRQDKYGK
jgi:hypothetical protein